MQAQIQTLMAKGVGRGETVPKEVARGTEVAKPQIFDGMTTRVAGFITACKLYIRIRMREETVERQIQWILLYVQGGTADVWKENVMEELETGEVEYKLIEDLLTCLKKEFGGGEEELVKVVKLRKLEQGRRTMEEFVQEFKRTARGSGYKGRLLVEEFKQGINGGIRRKLMKVESLPASIEQWYRRAMALDRNWRESKREKERLQGKKEQRGGALKQEQRQILPQLLVW